VDDVLLELAGVAGHHWGGDPEVSIGVVVGEDHQQRRFQSQGLYQSSAKVVTSSGEFSIANRQGYHEASAGAHAAQGVCRACRFSFACVFGFVLGIHSSNTVRSRISTCAFTLAKGTNALRTEANFWRKTVCLQCVKRAMLAQSPEQRSVHGDQRQALQDLPYNRHLMYYLLAYSCSSCRFWALQGGRFVREDDLYC